MGRLASVVVAWRLANRRFPGERRRVERMIWGRQGAATVGSDLRVLELIFMKFRGHGHLLRPTNMRPTEIWYLGTRSWGARVGVRGTSLSETAVLSISHKCVISIANLASTWKSRSLSMYSPIALQMDI